MYHASALTTGGGLAVTGLASGSHLLVAGATLIFLGMAMLRLVPRREA